MAGKSSLKDKLEDEELDLSMMQLQDIPVKVGGMEGGIDGPSIRWRE